MLILIFFAFLAGIVTILSPCILPVLPIVLSGSVGGGKRKPWGIVLGFIGSFTFFTLALSSLVKATGISGDILRTTSIILILFFGLSLVVPQIQTWTEKLFGKLTQLAPKTSATSDGFISGIVIGMSLGLLWAPCVGPILASVIALAASGTVSSTTTLVTLAYSIGTGIPMILIILGGRQLLQKSPHLLSHSATIQKLFGIVMIVTSMALYFNIDRSFQAYILQVFPSYGTGLTKIEDISLVKEQLNKLNKNPGGGISMPKLFETDYGSAPEFIAGGKWFNTPNGSPLTIKSLRGKVVLVDFWTYTCINCIRTLPYIREWHNKYKDKGLVIVGVHTPEFEFEKEEKNVSQAIKDFQLEYPIVQDNNYETWNAYANHYWPAKYLVDKNGRIRNTHFGEGNYDETEKKIQELLSEDSTPVTDVISNPTYTVNANTPESYVGFGRIQYNASPEPIAADQISHYSTPTDLPSNAFAFEGNWMIGKEYASPTKGASLTFNFNAKEVFLVMRPKTNTAGKINVLFDGKPIGTSGGDDVIENQIRVTTDRLYKIVKLTTPGAHKVTLEFLDDSLELYAFTFG